jgi:hypothetical protein
MSNKKKQPLVSSYQNATPSIILYDPDCALDMDTDKIKGFLVLLQNEELAFSALTDGNIIDACLGAPPLRREGERYLRTRDAKNALAASSDTSDSIVELAVTTYKRAFDIVIQHQTKLQQTNLCCRCFVQGRMRRATKAKLDETFKLLHEAVAASST